MTEDEEDEKYERDCAAITKSNEQLLADFYLWLKNKGLGDKTVQSHIDNIDFYVNYYLLHYDAVEPKDGVLMIDGFLGDFFVRKALWATASSLRQNAASLKKFYLFLHEQGQVSAEDLDEMKADLKENMPEYLEGLEAFDNGTYYNRYM